MSWFACSKKWFVPGDPVTVIALTGSGAPPFLLLLIFFCFASLVPVGLRWLLLTAQIPPNPSFLSPDLAPLPLFSSPQFRLFPSLLSSTPILIPASAVDLFISLLPPSHPSQCVRSYVDTPTLTRLEGSLPVRGHRGPHQFYMSRT